MSARNSLVSLSSNGSNKIETRLSSSRNDILNQQGPIIPSSSSKDDDLLSSSSNEIETMAMRTLDMLEESKSIMSAKNDDSSIDLEKGATKIAETEQEEEKANIQNEFGVCGWILTILSYLLIFFTLPISACMCIKVVQEYERAVIFRLGRLMPGGAKGPGIFFIVPCIDTYRKVDLRVLSFEVPPQEILSKDSVTVAVDAVVYFRISNATISVTNVEDAARSTKLLAQTTLRNILGTKTLAEMLSDREAISHQMQTTLDEATEPWGVKVERVEVKDVRLPVQLQRAMAAEAEAAREARAKVIVAEGEQKASRALKEAAEVIAESPSALQLRYLQTLNSISAEKNSTIIFPFPIDLLSAFLQRPAPKVEEPPSLPKKIRSCCLYKYPDWVQGMVGEGKPPVAGSSQGHNQSYHSHHQGNSGPSTTTTSGRPPLPHSMREAQFHSASHHQAGQQPTSQPSQLDPGSLNDLAKRRSAKPGGNTLLKQAIANRLKPTSEEATTSRTASQQGSSQVPQPVHRTDSNEMGKSLLLNPAWYRDEEGRTGYKTREWEAARNKQKEVVKDASKPTSPVASPKIDKIDDDLISEKQEPSPVLSAKEMKKKEKEEKKAAKEAEKLEKKAAKEKEKLERKLSKKKKDKEDTSDLKQEDETTKEKEGEEGNETMSTVGGVNTKKVSTTYATVKMTVKKEKKNESETEQVTVTRKGSTDSNASSQESKITINRMPIQTKQEASKQPSASKNIAQRRDSSLSKLSKMSYVSQKSVKFDDRIQMREIERRQISTSSDDDAAIMSDDELSRPDSEKRRKVLKLLHSQYHEEKMLDEDRREQANIYDDDLDDFEEQERLVMLAMEKQQEMEKNARKKFEAQQHEHSHDQESASLQSFYAEDVDPDRYLLEEDSSYISLDHLPTSVRQAILAEMKARPGLDQPLAGSMSRLHANDGSSDPSLLEYPGLPRSASGYFDPGFVGHNMKESYRKALYNQEPNPHQSPAMQMSYYENREDDSRSSLTPVPSPPRKDTTSSVSARDQFFAAMQEPKETSSSPMPQIGNVGSMNSLDGSTVTRRDSEPVEDEMRKRFVARFGPRKAPMAKEEDPADPEHVMMGSTESVISTDSRESVVSAASIKAEFPRRSFNY